MKKFNTKNKTKQLLRHDKITDNKERETHPLPFTNTHRLKSSYPLAPVIGRRVRHLLRACAFSHPLFQTRSLWEPCGNHSNYNSVWYFAYRWRCSIHSNYVLFELPTLHPGIEEYLNILLKKINNSIFNVFYAVKLLYLKAK